MARGCYLQNFLPDLFSQVSSSGGGLPGRLDLERDSGRSLFWGKFDSSPLLLPVFVVQQNLFLSFQDLTPAVAGSAFRT